MKKTNDSKVGVPGSEQPVPSPLQSPRDGEDFRSAGNAPTHTSWCHIAGLHASRDLQAGEGVNCDCHHCNRQCDCP